MEKRLYISPKSSIVPFLLDTNLMNISEKGEIEGPNIMTKDREDDEFEIEKESEKMTPEYSLW